MADEYGHKMDEMGKPSRVLHVRGLPAFTTDPELVAICSPFGAVMKILLLSNKQQAFVQMESPESAAALVAHYGANPIQIRNKPIFFQFSNRSEIKTSNNNAVVVNPLAGSGMQQDFKGGSQTAANSILLVSVLNTRVPVTLENIHQIFKPYGEVLRIITFVKGGVFKALVQMATVEAAINAKLLLEGKDMFQGCCHLRIGFSTLTNLTIKSNGPRSRDFTAGSGAYTAQAMQPATYLFQQQGQGQFGAQPGMPGQMAGGYGQQSFDPAGGFAPKSSSGEQSCVLLVNNLNPEKVDCDTLFTLFGVYGDVMRVKILYNKRDTAMIQFATAQQAYLAHLHLNHLNLYDKEISIATSKHSEVSLPRAEDVESAALTKDYTNSPVHRFKHRGVRASKNINPPSQVLHVSNLPDNTNEDELRKLFGEQQTMGQPAVQFFQTNRKMAFIKMDSLHDAVIALVRLHNFRLHDKYIRVSFSQKDPSQVSDSDAVNPGAEEVNGGAHL